MEPAFHNAAKILSALTSGLWGIFADVFMNLGSVFSLASLGTALVVGAMAMMLGRRPGKRRVRPRVLARAFFPRRVFQGSSARADIGLFLFNIFCAGTLFSGAILSAALVSKGVHAALEIGLGARNSEISSPALGAAIVTLTGFLAYELGYWIDHYLKHRVEFLWEFHKVHHTAEALTPLTAFRMHPVDSIIFGNILAIIIGGTNGLVTFAIGRDAVAFSINGANVILVGFLFLLIHLQHTHLWIAFTGVWGRLLVSPAHHQLHHSADPKHFGRNFGSCLAVWDWMFGTLQTPTKSRQQLRFGVAPVSAEQHSVTGCLVTPFQAAFAGLAKTARRAPSARPV